MVAASAVVVSAVVASAVVSAVVGPSVLKVLLVACIVNGFWGLPHLHS